VTTNTWQLYDELCVYAGLVLVVHPPHVALITRSQVMNDKLAASILARLLAKGLLVGVWVPPQEIRELRGLVAQRKKMTGLATQAKNRLHAGLQRHHWLPPEGNPFQEVQKKWWLALPMGSLERVNVQSDLDTLQFAEQQLRQLTSRMAEIANQHEEVTRLLQLPGFGVVTAVTVWAAIGDIQRFEDAQHLVGYAGLGTKVHDSGMTTRTGRITKAGRRDLRVALTEAAQVAANTHPHWKAELARLQPRLGRNTPALAGGAREAIAAIARKLLVAVWYILAQHKTDRFAQPEAIAQKFLKFAYQVGKEHRLKGQSAAQFARRRLDVLELGHELTSIAWGKKKPIPLPPSTKQ
jgi:transposase